MAPPQGFYETGYVLSQGGDRQQVPCVANPFLAGEVLYADVLLLPNGMSKVGYE